jgi:hypothetical protein
MTHLRVGVLAAEKLLTASALQSPDGKETLTGALHLGERVRQLQGTGRHRGNVMEAPSGGWGALGALSSLLSLMMTRVTTLSIAVLVSLFAVLLNTISVHNFVEFATCAAAVASSR